jgi:amino acid transporter
VSAPVAGLSRRALGGVALWLFAVGASSPMTVLAGSVPATYAGTGVVGVPLSFLLLGPALAVMTVGYVAVTRHVQHAAPIYAVLTHGLGRLVGVAGAAQAVLGYNAIQICLYGLVGATLAGDLGGTWWVWAGLVWLLIGVLGVFNVRLNAAVLGWLLGLELLLIAAFDLAALSHPAGGHLTSAPLSPSSLVVSGIGGALALGIAAFVGYEQPPVFVEEARRVSSVVRGTFAALGFLAVFYALSSWALAAAVGPDQVAGAAAQDPAFAFTVMEQVFGPLWGVAMAALGHLLLVTSLFAAMLAFHNSVARHLFALGREGVLPRRLGQAGAGTGRRSGAPMAASLTQSVLAFVVVAVFVALEADPVAKLFTWLATLAALSVMSLLAATCLAALGFFARTPQRAQSDAEGFWTRVVGPLLGFLAGALVLGVTVTHLDTLLGVAPGSPMTAVIPGLVVFVVLAGLFWALWLRERHPHVYQGIGAGKPHPLAVLDQRLADVEV